VPELPQHLRTRAAALRRQAAALDRQPLATVRLRAGDDTWIGPTAVAFGDTLGQAEWALRTASDGLRRAARALERQADAAMAGPDAALGRVA
jgi:uncharacterized protein YukE